MKPRVRIGLIVGVIGLVLNTCVFGFLGFLSLCGTIISLIAGGIAGSLAVQREKPATKNEGARAGATAGAITGGLMLLGQILGALGSWFYLQSTGMPIDVQVPNLPGAPTNQIGIYAGGISIALCVGLVGVLLAAGAGAGLGYLVTSEQTMTPPSQETMN